MNNKWLFQLLSGVIILSLTSCGGFLPTQKRATNRVKPTSAKVAKIAPKKTSLSKESVLKTYHGITSWYSIKTNHGRATASGRLLSNGAKTAAHKTFPFGTRIRVTSLFNGKSEILRITDRGPYTKNRLIDVTIGCAQRLGFYSRGTTKVKVEVLEWGTWKYRRT
ncbi:MAG: rare lipoprotein A [Akkermansiaceae bacterium]|jgi:rare lipoprotein A